MTIFYKIPDGDYIKAVHNMMKDKKKAQRKVFEIGPDDYLLEISGRAGDWLDKLSFVTYRGKTATFGGNGGKEFSHRFEGHTFGAFSGGHRDYLDFLEIPIIPVPQEFLAQFKPIQVNVSLNQGPVVPV